MLLYSLKIKCFSPSPGMTNMLMKCLCYAIFPFLYLPQKYYLSSLSMWKVLLWSINIQKANHEVQINPFRQTLSAVFSLQTSPLPKQSLEGLWNRTTTRFFQKKNVVPCLVYDNPSSAESKEIFLSQTAAWENARRGLASIVKSPREVRLLCFNNFQFAQR